MTTYSRPIFNIPVSFSSVQKERLYLYRYGDECIDVTGGWEVTNTRNMTCTLESNHISFIPNTSGSQARDATLHTVNAFNFLQNYDSLHMCFEDYITNSHISQFRIKVSLNRNDSASNDSLAYANIGVTEVGTNYHYTKNQLFEDFDTYRDPWILNTNVVYNNDLSKLSDLPTGNNYYISLAHASNYSQTGYAKIYAIWLERIVVPTAQNSQE